MILSKLLVLEWYQGLEFCNEVNAFNADIRLKIILSKQLIFKNTYINKKDVDEGDSILGKTWRENIYISKNTSALNKAKAIFS